MVLIHEISLGFLYGHMRFEISHAKLLLGINMRNPEDRSLENLVFYHKVLGTFFFSCVKKIVRNNGLGKSICVSLQKLVLFSKCIYFVLFIFVNILGLN